MVEMYFDDGLLDTFVNARPLCKKYGRTGILAIVTGYVGKPVTWQPYGEPSMNMDQIKIMIEEGWKIASHSVTHRPFVRLDQPGLEQRLGQWLWKTASRGLTRRPFARLKEESRQILRRFSFPLRLDLWPNLSDAEAEWEARESKRWILEELGVEPVCFVVPYDMCTEHQKKIILRYYPYVRQGIASFHNISQDRERLVRFLKGDEDGESEYQTGYPA